MEAWVEYMHKKKSKDNLREYRSSGDRSVHKYLKTTTMEISSVIDKYLIAQCFMRIQPAINYRRQQQVKMMTCITYTHFCSKDKDASLKEYMTPTGAREPGTPKLL